MGSSYVITDAPWLRDEDPLEAVRWSIFGELGDFHGPECWKRHPQCMAALMCRVLDEMRGCLDAERQALTVGDIRVVKAELLERVDRMLEAQEPPPGHIPIGQRMAEHLPPAEMVCETCGSTDGVTCEPDPFQLEIHDDPTPVALCDRCHDESSADI